MLWVVIVLISAPGFFVETRCDEYLGEQVAWYPTLEFFKYYPKIGDCFEIYNKTEKITPFICRRPINIQKQSCIEPVHLVKENKHCLVLKTPSNETLKLLCEETEDQLLAYHSDTELNVCFNVSKLNTTEEVCQKTFEKYSIGITTPDNFTILFDSHFCATALGKKSKEVYENFVNSFRFDYETRSCYKVFKDDQDISPYSCFNDNVPNVCIEELSSYENCEGIVTENNETVLLNCPGEVLQDNCVKIYTEDGASHVSCLDKVEERCVGLKTPSNLTVLVECYFCTKPSINKYRSYDAEKQRQQRKFVKTFFLDGLSNKHSYLNQVEFELLNTKTRTLVYGYWLPNSHCYGITLDTHETVVLECTSNDDKFKEVKPGCFPVIYRGNSVGKQTVCIKILDEECVGFVVRNWTVALGCSHVKDRNELSYPEYEKTEYLEKSAEEFKLYPRLNSCYEIYNHDEIDPYICRRRANPKNYTCIDWIDKSNKTKCLALPMPNNETLEIVCGDTEENVLSYSTFSTIKNCFNVYTSDFDKYGITEVCQKKFGNFSIGITTPSNYSILFDSLYCKPEKTPEALQEYQEFIGNFTFNPSLRSCYKVFHSSQEIGPYTCLSNETFEACVRVLDETKCLGIVTQNGEKIVLDCPKDSNWIRESGCVKLYTSDGLGQEICPEQIEEQCVGIVTPSNLTVLFECKSCFSTRGGSELPPYTEENRQAYRAYVEYFLYTLTQLDNALENETQLAGYKPEQDIILTDCYNEVKNYKIHTLRGHENCLGITLDNLETIVLGCPGRTAKKLGCYDVFEPVYGEDRKIIGPDHKVGNVCVKILNEWCVGITTPKNWTVALSCYKPSQSVCPLISLPNSGPPPRM